ncbi:hypothetical protein HZ326_25086 [Fusarium oxysporum f. sp. albedinis]|nr:hypothetical protein HZ326_25086 [Fusarium oxysporum f. sp. albedinis]
MQSQLDIAFQIWGFYHRCSDFLNPRDSDAYLSSPSVSPDNINGSNLFYTPFTTLHIKHTLRPNQTSQRYLPYYFQLAVTPPPRSSVL